MRGCLRLAAVAAALGAGPAAAEIVIVADPGGSIARYEQRYAAARAAGETVVIDGPCHSACTLVLGFVPRERLCATPRARLGFHAAWFPDPAGGRVVSDAHTRKLYALYPQDVRAWIARQGGLSARTILLKGQELFDIVPACPQSGGRRTKMAPPGRLASYGHNLEIPGSSKGLAPSPVTE